MTYIKTKRRKTKWFKRHQAKWLKILSIILVLVGIIWLAKIAFFEHIDIGDEGSSNAGVQDTNDVHLFSSRQEAKEHCPTDTIVWLNTAGGDYNFQGRRWYSNSTHGVYICKKEAETKSKKDALGKI